MNTLPNKQVGPAIFFPVQTHRNRPKTPSPVSAANEGEGRGGGAEAPSDPSTTPNTIRKLGRSLQNGLPKNRYWTTPHKNLDMVKQNEVGVAHEEKEERCRW